jgi:hypothetical protein
MFYNRYRNTGDAFASGFVLAFFVGFILFTGYLYFSTDRNDVPSGCSQTSVAKGILYYLKKNSTIYIAQQKTPPTKFSDFVVTSGPMTGAMTMTLEDIRGQTTDIKGNLTKTMTLTFNGGGTATYYLNGTEITGNYNFP